MSPRVRSQERPATRKAAQSIALFFGGLIVMLAIGGIMAALRSRALCDLIRYAGMWLQVAGVCVVVLGLLQKRVDFGRLGVLNAIPGVILRAWARLSALVMPPPRHASVSITVGAAALTATGTVGNVKAGPSPTLPERVSALEEDVRRFRSEVDTKVQKVQGDLITVTRALQQEQEARRTGDEEVTRRLENTELGRLHIDFVGLLWVILGIVATSMPSEVAEGLSWFAWVRALAAWLHLTTACPVP